MNVNSEFYNQLGFLFGSIGVILGCFFGILLVLRKGKISAKANIFLGFFLLCFALRMGKSLFHHYYVIEPTILNIFLCIFFAIGPLLWLYCFYLIKNKKVIKISSIYFHFIPLILALVLSPIIPAVHKPKAWVFYVILFVHGFLYCSYTLYWVCNSNTKNKRKILKHWSIICIISTKMIYINAVLIYFNVVSFYPSSSFVFSILLLILTVYGFNNLFIFTSNTEKYKNSSLKVTTALNYSDELKYLMNKEKLFLKPNLTLISLSERLEITSKRLSQIINQFEAKNYSQYIAGLRVDEAKKLLKKEEYKHYKISTIAYESGFSSISSFNLAFKKITGKTPIQYKESVKKSL